MTLDTFVLGSFESLWHYGLPTSLPSLHNINTRLSSSCATSTSCCSVSSNPITNAKPIPSQGAGSLQSLFAAIDEDGDGRLSMHEMCSLLAECGVSSQSKDFTSLVESSKLTPDLSLDFPQFARLYASFFGASQECPTQHHDANDGFDDELLDIFQVYDTNYDGFISAAELAAVLLNLGLLPDHCGIDVHLGTCQAYIDNADLDGNGLVDLEEFKTMMMNNNPATSGFSCPSFA